MKILMAQTKTMFIPYSACNFVVFYIPVDGANSHDV